MKAIWIPKLGKYVILVLPRKPGYWKKKPQLKIKKPLKGGLK